MGKAGRGEARMGVPECGVKGECPRVLCGGLARAAVREPAPRRWTLGPQRVIVPRSEPAAGFAAASAPRGTFGSAALGAA